MQESFPGPTFTPTQSLGDNVRSLIQQNATVDAPSTTTTRQILAELQPTYQQAYGLTFTESLATSSGSGVQLKPTDAQRKKLKRKIQRECRDHINEQLHKTDALTILSKGQSLESHKRMRMSQSFETPQEKYDRAKHSDNTSSHKHSPNFENVHWNKEGLLEKLKSWPKDISINWSELAREFNIPGSSC